MIHFSRKDSIEWPSALSRKPNRHRLLRLERPSASSTLYVRVPVDVIMLATCHLSYFISVCSVVILSSTFNTLSEILRKSARSKFTSIDTQVI